MSHITKLLRRSAPWVVLIIALLAIQALAELALPDYTANIMDVGISRNGIESNLPTQIRASELDRILLFLPPDEKEAVAALYERDGDMMQQKDNVDVTPYEQVVGRAIMMLSLIQSDQYTEQMAEQLAQMVQQMPPEAQNMPLMDLVAYMPEQQRDLLREQLDDVISQMPDSVVGAAAASYIQQEYEQIGKDVSQIQTRFILMNGLRMLLIALVAGCCTVTVVLICARISSAFCRDLRGGIFHRVLRFSSREMDEFSVTSLITRSTNDVQQIQNSMVMIIRLMFYAPILGIGAFIKVQGRGNSMTWIISLALALIVVIMLFMFMYAVPKFRLVQTQVDKVGLVARESLSGLAVIRAFSAEQYEEKRFDAANQQLTDTNLFVNRVMAFMIPTMMFIMNAVSILIVWVGAEHMDAGTMQIGDIMAVIQYSIQVIMSFLLLCMISVMLPRSVVSLRRIREVLDQPISIHDPEASQDFDPDKKGWVEFCNVSYRYPNADEDVLSNLTFTAKPGETIAFIGSTGSGKTTLINLIPRFFDVTKGKILVEGQDVRHVTQHELRSRIGYVPQKGVLFSGTVASNISYGNQDMPQQRVESAAETAQAKAFILEKSNQYESHISQGGANVSGGQKQRLSIARAIAADPTIYIFDDSFSALDFRTDATLRKELKSVTQDSTILIVAQRINTIASADRIYVLDEGRIVGSGSHQELLKNCDVYRQIALSQLSKEELEHE